MNKLFLINTRVWFGDLKRDNPSARLSDIDTDYWQSIKNKGYDSVWLLGIWDNNPPLLNNKKVATQYINEYRKVLPDITEADIIDSCFAINDYVVNPIFGDESEVLSLKAILNTIGLKLILDFVPNHFHFYSDVIKDNLDAFVHGPDADMKKIGLDVYQLPIGQESAKPASFGIMLDSIAHGKDPYTGSWSDTAQINWFSQQARDLMKSKLEYVSSLCDGVRCDMAMVIAPDNFQKTWDSWLASVNKLPITQTNWWEEIIPYIKNKKDSFVFIAECYWGMQTYMLDSGFDFVYDKDFYDTIISHNVQQLKSALSTKSHLPHSVIFLDNHDEERVASRLDSHQLQPAIVIQATLPGLKLYYNGQEQGSAIKLPMQIGRAPYEEINQPIYDWYQKIFTITTDPVFVLGDFEIVEPLQIDIINVTALNLVVFKRTYQQKKYIVVVNYSDQRARGYIPFVPEINEHLSTIVFEDKLTGKDYPYTRNLLMTHHLYVELSPWQSHIFEVREEI